MGSIWASIRTSLVQKVTDIRKREKCKSQKQKQNKQPQQDPISLSEDNHDLVSVETNNSTELKILIDKNIDLLEKFQNEARTQTTSDANDVVRGDVYQSILNVHKDFFMSVMIHSDGIPLYESKNYNAWPILDAVLELPSYSRTRTDNNLLLSLWIGKQKPNFNIIFEKLSK
ncbi:unnamed protein product [Rotaria sp. Silwood2]|nr:unnamed protein product [Rotaria sp. Silwood2]CAF4498110.1 unnamed protein product [Rotaria sp. Silwood2]